jgi:type II secretory pathway pseudopilin PulG
LAELIVVILVMGLLTAVVTGGLNRLLPVGRQEAALSKARVLNAARISYALLVPDADAQWNLAADDAARFRLLVDAGVIDGEGAEFMNAAGGYSLSLAGSLRAQTRLIFKGEALSYP